MIPKISELRDDFVMLGRLLARARELTNQAYADAREICGDGIMGLSTEQLLQEALEMLEEGEADEIVEAMMKYANARIWQRLLIEQRVETSALNLNPNGALIQRHWETLDYGRMEQVYNDNKARYHLSSEG